MQKLYFDCDGVILDTINKSYKYFDENGISYDNKDFITNYYNSLDWNKFLLEAGEIDNSVSKIKEINATGLYDISILTHVQSKNEYDAKKKYFAKYLPGIEIICVPKGVDKADFIDAKDAILVDDYLPNLDVWYLKGGIPVKFSSSNKKCRYMKITDLRELLDLKVKKIIKEK